MGNNTSVLIRYSNANRYKFQWYAEFLRFIGYFVCEYLKEDNDSDELDEYIYDIEFDLDNDEKTEIYDGILREFKGNEYECNYLKMYLKIIIYFRRLLHFNILALIRQSHIWQVNILKRLPMS